MRMLRMGMLIGDEDRRLIEDADGDEDEDEDADADWGRGDVIG